MVILPSIKLKHSSDSAQIPRALTIGNFDGCHLGHQKLIEKVVDEGSLHHLNATAMTFSPRPQAFFKNTDEKLLFTNEQKVQSFKELGVESTLIQNFDQEFSQINSECFYQTILKEILGVKLISIGNNFCFGKGRNGNASVLMDLCKLDDIQLILNDSILYKNEPISSSRIRNELSLRNIKDVNDMLGRPYMIEGQIKKGHQLGRTMGIPTINIDDCAQLFPGTGVYCGFVVLNKTSNLIHKKQFTHETESIPTIFNCGFRPTVSNDSNVQKLEGHLLSGSYAKNSLYDMKAGCYFTHFIRPEINFQTTELLKKQIESDIKTAKNFLNIS